MTRIALILLALAFAGVQAQAEATAVRSQIVQGAGAAVAVGVRVAREMERGSVVASSRFSARAKCWAWRCGSRTPIAASAPWAKR